MKVLVVTPYYYPKIGGLENYARQLALALQSQQQWEIVVATSNHLGRRSTMGSVDGMKVYRLGTLLKFSNTPLNPFWPLMLRRIIRREKPDVILAHTPVPSMSDAAALAAGRTPLLVTYHAASLLKGDSKIFNMVARAYGLYERLTLSRAARILAVSPYVKAELAAGLQSKTVVLPNAVWRDSMAGRVQPSGAAHFVFISSLDRTHSWKGLDQIIEALELYRDAYHKSPCLTVIGDGNYRTQYEALVRQAGLEDSVRFVGSKAGAAKDALLASATALVCYPTTSNDAFPTVMLEAWALGVPVVAAAIGPIPSLLHDGVDGYLVEAKTPAALAARLHQVATSDPEERQRIAVAAAKRTAACYTWEQQAAVLAQLSEELI